MRLGPTVPDFALEYDRLCGSTGKNDLLPYTWLDPECTRPGEPIHKSLHCMLESHTRESPNPIFNGKPSKFVVKHGFHLVLISSHSMHSYAHNMRGRLSLGYLQPVQVCKSLTQVAAVLRDPKKACPDENVEDAMAKMDALMADY